MKIVFLNRKIVWIRSQGVCCLKFSRLFDDLLFKCCFGFVFCFMRLNFYPLANSIFQTRKHCRLLLSTVCAAVQCLRYRLIVGKCAHTSVRLCFCSCFCFDKQLLFWFLWTFTQMRFQKNLNVLLMIVASFWIFITFLCCFVFLLFLASIFMWLRSKRNFITTSECSSIIRSLRCQTEKILFPLTVTIARRFCCCHCSRYISCWQTNYDYVNVGKMENFHHFRFSNHIYMYVLLPHYNETFFSLNYFDRTSKTITEELNRKSINLMNINVCVR